MRKVGKSSKKGFTLVELIVVLVILAVLAAMLVPALTGYIKKAREEKEYQTASTVFTATQALVTEYYGKTKTPSVAGAQSYVVDKANTTDTLDRVHDLAGLKENDFALAPKDITIDANTYRVTGIKVTIGGAEYSYDETSTTNEGWTAKKASTNTVSGT